MRQYLTLLILGVLSFSLVSCSITHLGSERDALYLKSQEATVLSMPKGTGLKMNNTYTIPASSLPKPVTMPNLAPPGL